MSWVQQSSWAFEVLWSKCRTPSSKFRCPHVTSSHPCKGAIALLIIALRLNPLGCLFLTVPLHVVF